MLIIGRAHRKAPRRHAAALIALAAIWLVACNAHDYQENRYRRQLHRAGMVEQTVSLPEGQIRYWEGGHGPSVLLLHGFGGHALWQWNAQAGPLIECGFHVVAPDLGWFGETVPAEPVYTVEAQAVMFLQLMEHLGRDRYDVVGLSYGGFVALRMAVDPRRVQRLVLVDSPGPAYGRFDYEDMLDRFDVRSSSELLIPRSPRGVRTLLDATFFAPPRVPAFALKDIYREMFTSRVAEKSRMLESVAAYYRYGQPQVPDRPTLIVWGEEDRLFPPELASRLAAIIGDQARIALIPRSGHSPNLERAEEFNRRLIEFLGCEQPAP